MPSPRASITPGWGQGTAENSRPPPGPSSSQVPATPAPAPRPRPAAARSPWPFCPRSAGVCCRCCREWRGSRSGMCFWTSCRRPSPQPRRSRPKYGHQLAKAIQGAGWSEEGKLSSWPPDRRPQTAGLGRGTLSPWTYTPSEPKHPNTETTATAGGAALPSLNGGGGPPAARDESLRSPEPAHSERRAQSRHGDHGLPVPFALKARPSAASLGKELPCRGTIFPSLSQSRF